MGITLKVENNDRGTHFDEGGLSVPRVQVRVTRAGSLEALRPSSHARTVSASPPGAGRRPPGSAALPRGPEPARRGVQRGLRACSLRERATAWPPFPSMRSAARAACMLTAPSPASRRRHGTPGPPAWAPTPRAPRARGAALPISAAVSSAAN